MASSIKIFVLLFSPQSNEVKSSSWCELEGLKRTITYLKAQDLAVCTLITDRHRQIAKWIRENLEDTRHYYDVWHVAKGKKTKKYIKNNDVFKFLVPLFL